MMRPALAAIVAGSMLSAPAAALVIRSDRDDAEYLEMGTRYTSAIALGTAQGEGVLIASQWIMTSAPVASALQAAKPPRRVEIAGRPYDVRATFHDSAHEVALILLQDAVRNIEPTPLCRDAGESGKTVVIVGHSGKKRAAINTVDRVTPQTLGLRIKPLDDASDLQGVATAAELGAPAFIETEHALCVAGVLRNAGAEWQDYARSSASAGWIDATMLGVAMKDADKLLDDTGR